MKKINSLLITIIMIVGVMLTHVSIAQPQTGSFDTTINYNSDPSWVLSMYVPPSYNPANNYKLIICLHGLGDTPENMRNFFLQSIYGGDTLGLVNNIHSPLYNNSIILCPYLSGVNTDLWEPVGDTSLVTKCIAVATSHYNIDPHYIYLSGFSVGARAALRYGLLNYWRFRGLELWTPAIQSMDEANNLTSFTYPWQNGKYIPTYISVGSADPTYPPMVTTGYRHLADAGAIVTLQIIYGLPHDPPANENTFFGFNYIDSHADSYAMNDAGISSISSPFSEICSTTFTPIVSIQNKGRNNLTTAIINYRIDNGAIQTYNWSGNLTQLGTEKVTLSAQTVSTGSHILQVYSSMPNGVIDTMPSNDTITESITSITSGTTFSQDFEGTTYPPAEWRLSGTDSVFGWQRASSNTNEFSLYNPFEAGAYGQSLSSIYFDNEVPDNLGKRYSIITPICDLSTISSPALQYDYAYAPYNTTYSDTLAVYYSIDCGNTWDTLLVEGGLSLSTIGGYDSTSIFSPDSTQWRHRAINLTKYGIAGQHEVMFSLEDRSGWGNLIYLDNININTVTGVINETQNNDLFNVYPNPTTGQFTLSGLQKDMILEMYDYTGKKISTSTVTNQTMQLNISQADGIYLIRILDKDGNLVTEKKVVKMQ